MPATEVLALAPTRQRTSAQPLCAMSKVGYSDATDVNGSATHLGGAHDGAYVL